MKRMLEGTIVAIPSQTTVIVSVMRKKAHPLYKKIFKRSKRFVADSNTQTVHVGDVIRMEETRPLSKKKHFKVVHVLPKNQEKEEKKK